MCTIAYLRLRLLDIEPRFHLYLLSPRRLRRRRSTNKVEGLVRTPTLTPDKYVRTYTYVYMYYDLHVLASPDRRSEILSPPP